MPSTSVFIVTGAAKKDGIGFAAAKELAKIPGAAIVINYNSSADQAETSVATLKSLGAQAIAVQANISTESGAKKLVDAAISAFGEAKIAGLVNNAGVPSDGPLDQVSAAQFTHVFNNNVLSIVLLTGAASPHIQEGGAIVNISSAITHAPFANYAVYTASKGAVEAYTRAAAIELAPRHIRVNTVSPGVTATNMMTPDFHDMAANITPFKRVGLPEDIGKVIAFLVKPESSWVTGQNVNAAGGLVFSF
ncbi:hypothetical protein HK100_008499 [Physocladia obscura]|uniref:Ketoreductase domain-containing protein n=1 Tax=Physocladia obscura TaxID=109957 RepID=A0AAD5SMU2_9FUNG|nr:hypothetical protein HK100_008499 [Physocladia obscura]